MAMHKHVVNDVIKRLSIFASLAISTIAPMCQLTLQHWIYILVTEGRFFDRPNAYTLPLDLENLKKSCFESLGSAALCSNLSTLFGKYLAISLFKIVFACGRHCVLKPIERHSSLRVRKFSPYDWI